MVNGARPLRSCPIDYLCVIYTLVYTRDSRVATQGGHATYCRVDRDTCQTDHPLPSAYLMCSSGLVFTLMFQY